MRLARAVHSVEMVLASSTVALPSDVSLSQELRGHERPAFSGAEGLLLSAPRGPHAGQLPLWRHISLDYGHPQPL